MPSEVTLYVAGVWVCVGLCVGFGWAIAHAIVARLTR